MGFHPNFPSAHMYDLARDGSSVFTTDSAGNVNYTFTSGEAALLGAWTSSAKGPSTGDYVNWRIVALFPDNRQVSNVMVALYRNSTSSFPTWVVQYSLDTTNGNNGTWTTVGTYSINQASVITAAQMRSTSCNFPVNVSGVKAVRVFQSAGGGGFTFSTQSFAVWGTTTPTGLVLWNPTLDQQMYNSDNLLDRGDVYTNQTPSIQQFRIKNTGSQTANSVVVQMDTGTALTTIDTDTTFSIDGTNYAATQTISSIAAGAISGIVYMKRGTPTDAASTTRVATLRAIPGSWT